MRCGYLFCVERLTFEHLLTPEQWYGNWTSKFRLPGESIMVNSTRWNVIATCTVSRLKIGGIMHSAFLTIFHFSPLHSNFLCKLWFLSRKILIVAFSNLSQLCGTALITIGCVVRVSETLNQNWLKKSDPNNKSHIIIWWLEMNGLWEFLGCFSIYKL